jgi:hypothetical protein
VARLGSLLGIAVSLMLLAGCGGGQSSETQAGRTWRTTVADTFGSESGPNELTALRAAAEGYMREYPSDPGQDTSGCHPTRDIRHWQCQVHGAQCTANVTVEFSSTHNPSAVATSLNDQCRDGTMHSIVFGSKVPPVRPVRPGCPKKKHCGGATATVDLSPTSTTATP